MRKTTLVLLEIVIIGLALSGAVHAQTLSAKPARIIVPFPPGGGTDAYARLIAAELAKPFGGPVIVDNRTGASGLIGSEAVVKSAPDGRTLLFTSASLAINATLYPKLPFNPLEDLTPISLVATVPHVLVVHPSLKVRGVQDLLKLARGTREPLIYASGSSGTTGHLSTELFKAKTGIQLTHVPYKGAGPAVVSLISGETFLSFLVPGVVKQHVQSARLRALAVTSRERSYVMPDVPTMIEQGLKGFETLQWHGIFGPRGMPADTVNRLNKEIRQILLRADIREKFAPEGADVIASSPDQFATFMALEIKKWAEAIRVSGAQRD